MRELRRAVAGGSKRVVLQAPTGAGKTEIAAAVVKGALAKNGRVIFTVPALSLIDQTVDLFWKRGIDDIGVIQSKHELTNGRAPVQIASVQTLAHRVIPRATVVVIDEVHKLFKFYARWLADPLWSDVPFIGLSATPWTRGLGNLFDTLIVASTTQQLIAEGFLSPFRVFGPTHPDLSTVRVQAGDYVESDLSRVMRDGVLVADVIDTWRRLAEGRPTFVFAVDRAHARDLAGAFLESGIDTEYIDMNTTMAEREAIRAKFHSGSVKVVVNVGCLTTGVDWDVRCIVLARPTKSEMLYVQMIGRGLRIAEGKDDCLILDHSDTTERLGFVTDIGHDRMLTGKLKDVRPRVEKEKLPKVCPSCSFLKPAGVHKCPSCGFAPVIQSQVRAEEGELVEMTVRPSRNNPLLRLDRKAVYGGLMHIADQRGYQSGWVAHKYREIYGVWPRGLGYTLPCEPPMELRGWLKSRQIAHAKAMEKPRPHARWS